MLPLAAACALTLTGCEEDLTRPIADKVLVVGHRGASALRPEHTLASYTKAIEDGADIIEPDLVSTKDGVLVARHENEISGTTNVADVAKFADRKTTKTIDGVQLTGWFTEDFTLAELKELRARERIPQVRPDNKTNYNDQFEIPTLSEVIALAKDMSGKAGRTIHIYPETKHPTYFQSIGLPLEDRLISTLKADAFTASQATVYIQSFEVANLKAIREKIGTSQPNWRLVQLMDEASKQPYDFVKAGDARTYGALMTAEGMKEIAKYANGVGPYKLSIVNVDSAGQFQAASELVRNAHAAKLLVHPYTFRPENNFLPAPLKSEGVDSTRNPAGSIKEIQTYLDAGIDGFFTDDPAVGRQAVDTYNR
ncbi:glycerophosphodiester phosphodiesterase [Vitiosangium sp. GDMCC 1.1324]|uniref:glycerophosphodiester phosphodiesterase n=1 Tax=Vitiosangium sp. (strain GDMCC 1.1324) TaxID=2138576 RepID=UPI001E395D79|nr:glycerophosphodiester phosphodiesterase [Vitiosangium sp. GDMCC 1.1324]